MKNFLPQLRQKASADARAAGGSAGRTFGDAFGDSAKASVEAAQSKVAAAQKKAADATGALTVAQARLDDIRKKSNVSASTLAAAEERVAKAQRNVELQASGVARAQNQLGVAQAYASRESDNLTQSLHKQSIVGKAIGGTLSAVGTVIRRAWLPVSAAVTGAGAVGIRTAANLEQARIAFTNMLGSAEAADKFLRKLSDFAAKTPFEFTDVTRASQRLMAMGISAQDVIPYLTAIGDAVSAMGGGAEQVDQVTTAIGQMAAKGRIQSDELLQLTEAGIPALKILAAQYGVTTGEMQDMITKGQVLSADALPKLIDGLENGTSATQAFGGMMDQQSKSLTGLWSTATDTVKANLAQAFTPLIPALKAALSGGTTLVGDFLSRFQQWSTTVIAQFPNLVSAIAAQDAQGVGEVIDNILGNTGRYVGTFRSIAAGVFPLVNQLWQLFTNLRGIASDLGPVLGTILGGGLRLAWEALNLVLPLLVDVTGWLADNKPVVIGLATAWAALTLATKAHAAALAVSAAGGMVEWIKQGRIIQAVTKAWAAVQWVLNAALNANPIVLIVTGLVALGAALVLAWQHSETFRKIVTGALSAVADAGLWMWNNVLKPTWDALVTAWNAISTAIQWGWEHIIRPAWDAIAFAAKVLFAVVSTVLIAPFVIAWNLLSATIEFAWNNIVKPVWDAIAAAAGWLWNTILAPIWAAMQAGWSALMTAIEWAWNNIALPVWNAIAAAAQWLWNNVLTPIWSAMQAGWDALLTAIQFAWNSILRPTWVAIETAANWLWENVLQPIWAAMQGAWDALLTAMQWAWDNILHPVWVAIETAANWLWNNVLSPIWTAMSTAWDGLIRGMRWVYDNVIHPMWKIIEDAINGLSVIFQGAVDAISAVWMTFRKITATPINFMIHYVIGGGLLRAWNAIVGAIGLDQLQVDWESWGIFVDGSRPGWAEGGSVFDRDGRVGGFSPHKRADNINARLTAGEFVEPVDSVNWYGVGAMEAVRQRKALIYYADGGLIPGLATGGQLFDAVAAQFPGVRLTSGYRPGDPGYHGKNMAADIAGPQPTPNGSLLLASIEQWIASKYGKGTTELIYDGFGDRQADLYHGAPHTYSASTRADHHNHVHWAMVGALSQALAAGSAGGEAGILTTAGGSFTSAAEVLAHLTKTVVDAAAGLASNPWAQVAAKAPLKLLGKMWGWLSGKLETFFASSISDDSNTPVDAQGLKNQAYAVAQAMYGWGSPADRAGIDYIVGKESGWNPRAQNPSSTASGLWQHIRSTWQAYRPIEASSYANMKDAPAGMQDKAGIRYIHDRYGTIPAAQRFWAAHHYYGQGGLVTPMLLDTGGLWPHGALGLNMSGGDERVLRPDQDDYWTRFVDVADRVIDVGGGRRALIERVEINVRDNDTAFQAIDLLEHRLQVADLGGRYAWTDS